MQAVRDGVQDVAVKVLAASPTEAIQLHALKKVSPCVAMSIMLKTYQHALRH